MTGNDRFSLLDREERLIMRLEISKGKLAHGWSQGLAVAPNLASNSRASSGLAYKDSFYLPPVKS